MDYIGLDVDCVGNVSLKKDIQHINRNALIWGICVFLMPYPWSGVLLSSMKELMRKQKPWRRVSSRISISRLTINSSACTLGVWCRFTAVLFQGQWGPPTCPWIFFLFIFPNQALASIISDYVLSPHPPPTSPQRLLWSASVLSWDFLNTQLTASEISRSIWQHTMGHYVLNRVVLAYSRFHGVLKLIDVSTFEAVMMRVCRNR